MASDSKNSGGIPTVQSLIMKPKKRDVVVHFKKINNTRNPVFDETRHLVFESMNQRHFEDVKYVKSIEDFNLDESTREPSTISFEERDPSYTKFKVPYPMICKERFDNAIRKYNTQINSEIRKLIDNQLTATEATYFVRSVSYTSLWPPYHTEAEISETSRNFYCLRPREKARLKVIMETDFR